MKTKLLIAAIMGALMLLILPAAADYSGDHPLVPVESGTIKGDVLYLVEDNTSDNYLKLTEAPVLPPGSLKPNVTQTFIASIPDGAEVKFAKLYNYYTWSRKDLESANPGAPAEADITFSSDTSTMSVQLINPCGCDVTSCANPLVYTDIPNVIHYWDSKGPLSDGTHYYNYAYGNIAMDVTSMVTGSGEYTATIEHATDGNTMCFNTYGFALLIVYEAKTVPPMRYWITEGADVLSSSYGFTPEEATTEVLSASILRPPVRPIKSAELKVMAAGTENPEILTAVLADGIKIGAFPVVSSKSLSLFDEATTLNLGENIFSARDEGDFYTVFNAILVERPKPQGIR